MVEQFHYIVVYCVLYIVVPCYVADKGAGIKSNQQKEDQT